MVKIVVSRKIPDKFYQQLSKLGDVVMWQKSLVPMPKDQFVTALRDADACFITLSEQIDAEILAQSPNLKVIANMAVGYDNIDVESATANNVVVTNTPNVLTETTAELGFTLMLAIARRIVEAEKYVEADACKAGVLIYCQVKMSSIQLLEYMVWEILVKLLQEGCKGLILIFFIIIDQDIKMQRRTLMQHMFLLKRC